MGGWVSGIESGHAAVCLLWMLWLEERLEGWAVGRVPLHTAHCTLHTAHCFEPHNTYRHATNMHPPFAPFALLYLTATLCICLCGLSVYVVSLFNLTAGANAADMVITCHGGRPGTRRKTKGPSSSSSSSSSSSFMHHSCIIIMLIIIISCVDYRIPPALPCPVMSCPPTSRDVVHREGGDYQCQGRGGLLLGHHVQDALR